MHPERGTRQPVQQREKKETTPQPQIIVVQVPTSAAGEAQTVQVIEPAPPRALPAAPARPRRWKSGPRVVPPTAARPAAPAPTGAPMPGNPDQLARMITMMLAQKGGNAIEVASLAAQFAARGVGQQAVRAALWHAHTNNWVKKSGKGKVAATARTVRAGGVPAERKPGKKQRKASR